MNPLTFTPEQREDIRARIADGQDSVRIAAAMGCNRKTILNVALNHKLGPWLSKPAAVARFPIPDDFVTFAPGKTQQQLATHYGVSRTLAARWQRRAGVTPNPTTRATPVPPKAPAPAKPAQFVRNYSAAPVDRPQRDMSPAGLAQEILQRDRWTVFRCNAEGRADVAGRFWLCGRVICTDDELIERADRAARRMAA